MLRAAWWLGLVTLFFVSCGGGNTFNPTPEPRPNPPAGSSVSEIESLTLGGRTQSDISIEWIYPLTANVRFELFLDGTPVATEPASSRSYQFQNLVPDSTHTLGVRACVETNCSSTREVIGTTLPVEPGPGVLALTGEQTLLATGPAGGPFLPGSVSYTLTNVGGLALNWGLTYSKISPWVSASTSSGTLQPSESTVVLLAFTSQANSLVPNTYTTDAIFTDLSSGAIAGTRPISLTVTTPPSPGVLTLSPPEGLVSTGTQGGPFSPAQKIYELMNTGGSPLTWTAEVVPASSWLSLSSSSGTLSPGAKVQVTVSFSQAATGLGAGNYATTLEFKNTSVTSAPTLTRSVALTVSPVPGNGVLEVTPSTPFLPVGAQGGPFQPDFASYNLKNTGNAPLNWDVTLSNSPAWIALSSTAGTLQPNATATVGVLLTNSVQLVSPGTHALTITFANATNSLGTTTRSVILTVNAPPTPPQLAVTPSSGWTLSGKQGGPFGPQTTKTYALTNTGGAPLEWDARSQGGKNWYTISPDSGTLAPNSSVDVILELAPEVNGLPAATHTDTVQFRNQTNGVGTQNRTVTIDVTTPPAPGALTVAPATAFTSSGVQGGPFSPSSATYTLQNTGGTAISWTATLGQSVPWLNLSQSSGTLGAGATTQVTVTLNAATNGLSAGNYSNQVNFSNQTNGVGSTSRSVILTVSAPPNPGVLSINPTTGFSSAGTQGGPFVPTSKSYTLSNTGGTSLTWSATKQAAWLSLSSTGGSLAPGGVATLSVQILASAANSLAPGSYSDTVTVTNATNPTNNFTLTASLTVSAPVTPPTLSILEPDGLTSSGFVAGPFDPPSKTYTIRNTGGAPLNWSAVLNTPAPWVTVSPASGTIPAQQQATVLVSIAAPANSLSAGNYANSVLFKNLSAPQADQSRSIALTVLTPPDPPTLVVSPTTPFVSSGLFGGPFSPTSTTVKLENTGDLALTWTATVSAGSWLALSGQSGTIEPGAFENVTLSIAPGAALLSPGSYSTTVTFANDTTGIGNASISASLTVTAPPTPGVLSVSPPSGFSSSGYFGGPFLPSSQTYTLTNTGGTAVPWTATVTGSGSNWVTLSATSGTLPPGPGVPVSVTINSAANSLPVGTHTKTVQFTNSANPSNQFTQTVQLTVVSVPSGGTIAVEPSQGFSATEFAKIPVEFSTYDDQRTYVFKNDTATATPFTVTTNKNWLYVFPSEGTIPANSFVVVRVSLNKTQASKLSAGIHTGTVSFKTTTPSTNINRTATLTLTSAPAGSLTVIDLPPDKIMYRGVKQVGASMPKPSGDPWIAIKNEGYTPIEVEVSSNQGWLTVGKPFIALQSKGLANDDDFLWLTINSSISTLPVGEHTATVTITNKTNGNGSTTALVKLVVTAGPPPGELYIGGHPDVPFTEFKNTLYGFTSGYSLIFGIANIGSTSITWSANSSVPWLKITPASGTLPAGTDLGTVSLSAELDQSVAKTLSPGVHTGIITFTSSGLGSTTRKITLTVNAYPFVVEKPDTLQFTGNYMGPFTPSSATVKITNTKSTPLQWYFGIFSASPALLGASPTSGTLAPGASTTVTISITSASATALPGFYNISFLLIDIEQSQIYYDVHTGFHIESTPQSITLMVTPNVGFQTETQLGEAVWMGNPTSENYFLRSKNLPSGGGLLAWSASVNKSWITLSATSGTIDGFGDYDEVIVTVNDQVKQLPIGVHTATVTFTNQTTGLVEGSATREIVLTVTPNDNGIMQIYPLHSLSASKPVGGSFSLQSHDYTIGNIGDAAYSWTAAPTVSWLTVNPTSGSSPPNLLFDAKSTVTLNAGANALPPGTHLGQLFFSNVTSSLGSTNRDYVLFVEGAPASCAYEGEVEVQSQAGGFLRVRNRIPSVPADQFPPVGPLSGLVGVRQATQYDELPELGLLDSSNCPVALWQDYAMQDSKFRIFLRRWNGTTWTELGGSATGDGVLKMDSSGAVAMAAGPSNKLYVLVTELQNNGPIQARAKEWTGSSWQFSLGPPATGVLLTVPSSQGLYSPTIALSPAGKFHFAVLRLYGGSLPGTNAISVYKVEGQSITSLGTIDTGGVPDLSLAFSSENEPVVGWIAPVQNGRSFRFMRREGAQWVEISGSASSWGWVNRPGSYAHSASMKLHENGDLYIAVWTSLSANPDPADGTNLVHTFILRGNAKIDVTPTLTGNPNRWNPFLFRRIGDPNMFAGFFGPTDTNYSWYEYP